MKSSGPRARQTLSVKQKDFENQQLPKPLEITEKVVGEADHGLWEFFKDGKLLQTPVEESRHGRAWTVGELRGRDWDTLHALWWVCVKERNRLATEKLERTRIKAGYGDFETQERDKTVQETMKAILDTLAERHHAYEEAYYLAQNDPSIDLERTDGPQLIMDPAYSPYEEDAMYEDEPEPEKKAQQAIAIPKDEKPAEETSKDRAKMNTIA